MNSRDYYLRYVEIRYLKRHLVIPAFLALFLVIMYLVGKLLAAGIGRIAYQIAGSSDQSIAHHSQCVLVGQTGYRFRF